MNPAAGATPGGISCAIDVACFTLEGRRLMRLDRADRPALPWAILDPRESLPTSVSRIIEVASEHRPRWQASLGAFERGVHPARARLTIAYAMVVTRGTAPLEGHEWTPASDVERLPPRQADVALAAATLLRERTALEPIAFHLLPPRFTLSELQQAYEVLLRRRLHKASFRRALRSANLIAETGERRSAGRGRPAQLYRHAPSRASTRRPSLPFDLVG